MQTQIQEPTNNFFKHIPHTTQETHKLTALYKAMHSNHVTHSDYGMNSNLRDGLHNAIFANLRSNAAETADNVNNVENLTITSLNDVNADVQEEMYSRSDIILAVSITMFFAFICSFLFFYCVFKVRKWRLERSRAHRAENANVENANM